MIKRIGQRTLQLENRPFLLAHAAAVGKKEGEGPLGAQFDFVTEDDRMGQKSWELAESELQKTAIETALKKAGLQKSGLDMILAGDLLNQCIGSFLASMQSDVPYLGQYGACSTMAQGLALGACLVEGGAARRLVAAASSHFCSAERQYRFPLAYGGQRTPTAQWTATAAGAAVLGEQGSGHIRITHALFGKMVEMGVKDANNMGAAMAPEDVNLDPYINGAPKAVFCSRKAVFPNFWEGRFPFLRGRGVRLRRPAGGATPAGRGTAAGQGAPRRTDRPRRRRAARIPAGGYISARAGAPAGSPPPRQTRSRQKPAYAGLPDCRRTASGPACGRR